MNPHMDGVAMSGNMGMQQRGIGAHPSHPPPSDTATAGGFHSHSHTPHHSPMDEQHHNAAFDTNQTSDVGVTRSFITHQSSSSSSTLASAAVQRHAAAAAAAVNLASAPSSASFSQGKMPYLAFQYSTRLALVLLPALFIILAAGGRPLLSVICIGALSSYALDSFGTKEGAFVAQWLAVIGSMLSLTFSNSLKSLSMFSTLLVITLNLLIFFIGVLLSLQYDFLIRELLPRGERLLFGVLFLPLSTIEMVALMALGVEVAPFLFCIILTVNYYALLQPLPSSKQLCELGLDSKSIAAAASRPTKAADRMMHNKNAPSAASLTLAARSIPTAQLDPLVSALSTGVQTMIYLGLPYFFHLAIHHHFFLQYFVSAESLLLITIQFLSLSILNVFVDVLWFAGFSPPLAQFIRRFALAVSSLFFVLLIEARIILPLFGKYLVLYANWPLLCFILLTASCYAGISALGILFLSGRSDADGRRIPLSDTRQLLFKTLIHFSFFTLGLSVGVPLYAYPFIILTSYSAGIMLLKQDPLWFAVTTALWSIFWYGLIHSQLSFISLIPAEVHHAADAVQKKVILSHMASTGQGSLMNEARLMWLQASLGMVLPTGHLALSKLHSLSRGSGGLDAAVDDQSLAAALGGSNVIKVVQGVLDLLFCFYFVLLGFLEWGWVRMDQKQTFDSFVYGWYIVCFTSVLGVGLSYMLSPKKYAKINAKTYVAAVTICIWKLGVLFFDDFRDLTHFALFLAVTVPLFLAYDQELYWNSQQRFNTTGTNGTYVVGAHQMTKTQGLLHFAAIVGVMWICKNTILAHVLHWSDLYQIGGTGEVNESTYVGFFLIATAFAVLPLSFKHFKYDTRFRRYNVLFVLLSILFFIIQPRLDFLPPGSLFGLDDTSDVFERSMETMAPRWPAWMLLAALATIIFTFASASSSMVGSSSSVSTTSGSSGSYGTSLLPRPLLALTLGSSLGIYLIGLFLPFQPILYTLFIILFNLVSFFIIYLFMGGGKKNIHGSSGPTSIPHQTGFFGVWNNIVALLFSSDHYNPSGSSNILPFCYLAFVTLLPVVYFVIGIIYSPHKIHGSNASVRVGGKAAQNLVGEVQFLYRVSLLSIHTALNFLIALFVNLHREISISIQSKESRFKNLQLYGVSSGGRPKEDTALLFIGNMACVFTFLSACYLHLAYMTDSSLWGVLAIAPILLLINADGSEWFGSIREERRWYPVGLAATGILVYMTCLDLFLRTFLAPIGLVNPYSAIRTAGSMAQFRFFSWWGLKNTVLLLCTMPQVLGLLSFLWNQKQRISGLSLLLLGPLLLVPLIFTDLLSIQILSLIGLLGIVVEAVSMHKTQQQGRRMI